MNNFLKVPVFFKANVQAIPSAMLKVRSGSGNGPAKKGDDYRKKIRAGKVWLVGAGPGDAELLTVKAVRAINSADVIFYDYLVSEEIRALFPKKCSGFLCRQSKKPTQYCPGRFKPVVS